MAQIDLKKATVKFKDGSAVVKSLTLKVHEGTLSYTEHKNRQYVKDRGKLSTVRDADEEPVDVRMDLVWEFITATAGSGTPTPVDVIKKTGEAATWVTADSDTCAPYALDIEIAYDPGCTGVQKETITLSDFRYETVEANLKEGTFSLTGKCNVVEATAVRSA